MRGRTLNDAFIILDEAQNTSPEQMKMFLTRLGFGSQMVVTGDVTQIDLPGGTTSGLRIVREILDDIDDVEFLELTAADVVRHQLVGQIVDAYGRWDASSRTARRATPLQRPSTAIQGPTRADDEHRGRQRVRRRGRRDPHRRALAVRARPACGSTLWPSCRSCSSTSTAMEQLHVQWMDEPGPTDVLAFPMDELRPGQ